jgi:hypothetical protein
VLRLRLADWTFAEIGRQLGIREATARRDYAGLQAKPRRSLGEGDPAAPVGTGDAPHEGESMATEGTGPEKKAYVPCEACRPGYEKFLEGKMEDARKAAVAREADGNDIMAGHWKMVRKEIAKEYKKVRVAAARKA